MQVKGLVYSSAGTNEGIAASPECEPTATVPPTLSTAENRVSNCTAVRIEEQVLNREKIARELDLQARLLRKRREAEELEQKLLREQGFNDAKARARFTTAGVCASLPMEPPPKRTKKDGRGNEEAIVLTAEEQLRAARAKQLLKDKRGEMQSAIKEAKKIKTEAGRVHRADRKKVVKAIGDLEKAAEKAESALQKAMDNIPLGEKKVAATATRTAAKAAAAAHSHLQAASAALTVARKSLVEVNRRGNDLKQKEVELI